MALVEQPNQNQPQAMILTPDQQKTLKNTYAKDLSNDEFALFLQVAKSTGLNPFLKEIIPMKFVNDKGVASLTFMTTRDGYLKIAQTQYTAEYEGLISFAVFANDEFEVDAANYTVKHKFGLGGRGRGMIVGAWARADRKGRKPQICYVSFEEYDQKNKTWNHYPSGMIIKVAEAFVLKRQYVITGLVTREEMKIDEMESSSYPQLTSEPSIPKPTIDKTKPISLRQIVNTEKDLKEIDPLVFEKEMVNPKNETTIIINVPKVNVPKAAEPEVKPEPLSLDDAKLPPKPSFNRKKKTSKVVVKKDPIIAGDPNDDGIPDNAEDLIAQALEDDHLEEP